MLFGVALFRVEMLEANFQKILSCFAFWPASGPVSLWLVPIQDGFFSGERRHIVAQFFKGVLNCQEVYLFVGCRGFAVHPRG